jgi:hypothetical protein
MNEDITLPYEISTCGLSLEEIGTIYVMFALPSMQEEDRIKWSRDSKFMETTASLIDKKFLEVDYDENDNLEFGIDIDKIKKIYE